ncbi:MAG: hypothetical protein IJ749_04015 [Eubacterium sp.]|nr:hypothetical protein [Eubacterium sp.]
MGILSRFKDIMASNINAIFKNDKATEKNVRKYLDGLRIDLGQVKSETEALKIEEQRARRALDENLAEQDKYRRYIEKSEGTPDERIYQTKLDRAIEEGERLTANYDKAKKDLADLSTLNEKLSSDISSLETKLSESFNAANTAKEQEALYEKMNDAADYLKDKAEAMNELNSVSGSLGMSEIDELTKKYDDTSSDEE